MNLPGVVGVHDDCGSNFLLTILYYQSYMPMRSGLIQTRRLVA
jgi:hypothetical protein